MYFSFKSRALTKIKKNPKPNNHTSTKLIKKNLLSFDYFYMTFFLYNFPQKRF